MVGIVLSGLLIALAAGAPNPPAAITIDYPQEGSIFPPEITPPTFLWRDSAKGVALWRIDVSFGDGAAAIHATSKGERLRIGKIDPDCVADTNEPPKLTPELAAAHSWTPDPATWQAIKRHSVASAATVTITGFRGDGPASPSRVERSPFALPSDPVGAPIFYRDVPLMPSELEKGVIKPLAARGHAAGRLASSQRRRSQQPGGDGEPAGVRQLPFVLRGRQDHGNGPGWPAGQPGDVHPGAGCARDGDPQARRDSVEFAGRQAEGERPDRLHVAGFAGRAVRGDHGQPGRDGGRLRRASQQLLRRQFQGLPVPPGVLSDARDSELVQPPDGSAAAARRRRRPAVCADGRGVEPRRPVPGICARRGHRPQSAGRAAGEIRQRPQRAANQVRPLPDSVPRR